MTCRTIPPRASFPLKEGDVHPGAAPGNRRRTDRPGPPPTTATFFPDTGAPGRSRGSRAANPPWGGPELLGADVDALVVGVAHTLVLTAVGADGARNEGKGVAVGDDLQSLLIVPGVDPHEIGGNILMNGAPGAAGGGKTVQQRDLLVQLAAGDGLHGLMVVGVGGERLPPEPPASPPSHSCPRGPAPRSPPQVPPAIWLRRW